MTSEIRIWHHGIDPSHTAFRIMSLLCFEPLFSEHSLAAYPIVKLKILDLFMAYPSKLKSLSYTIDGRRELRAMDDVFHRDTFLKLPSSVGLFRAMEPIHKVCLQNLAAVGVIEKNFFLGGTARLNYDKLSPTLQVSIKKSNDQNGKLLDFLSKYIGSLELNGQDNIFRFTGLHRSFS